MDRITVKELIEILQTFNPELEVWIDDSDYGMSPLIEKPYEDILLNEVADYYRTDIGKTVVKIW